MARQFRRWTPLVVFVLVLMTITPATLVGAQSSTAAVTSPAAGATVTGNVEIRGTALPSGPNGFQYYKVEYGPGTGDSGFVLINATHNSPVSNGVLETWNTAGLAPGAYTLRLRVVDTTGNYQEATVPVAVGAGAGSPPAAGAAPGAAAAAAPPAPARITLPNGATLERTNAVHQQQQLAEGKRIFRFDTFGDEAFWGDTIQLHKAIEGEKFGGVGGGVSPKTALSVGLKVDSGAVPAAVAAQIKAGKVNLDDPATTLALLKLNAVVGITGHFNKDGSLSSMGVQCALCHSTVDNSFAPGIGRRLDGWPNRDLNVGAIVALAPNLQPVADLLGTDVATVQKVLNSWGPGKYDAELLLDGKAFQPDGRSSATLLPAAFGLAGINLHTYAGFGSVPYWNAYVAVTQMHGKGTFFDPRLNDAGQFPVAAKAGLGNVRNSPDLVTSKLPALHLYQLSIPAPKPPAGSFNAAAATRGQALFDGKARCASCHVPPLYTEPGWNMHTGAEIGIDDFQANRSPDKRYRTTPLKGLWTHQQGGFYHDGRFATLPDVVNHYNSFLGLNLTDAEINDLVEYLKSL